MNRKLLFSLLTVMLIIAILPIKAQYFTPVWEGNPGPGETMNFLILAATIDGVNLQTGDSVAVLDIIDGELSCVGAKKFTSYPIDITAKKDDGTGNGFNEGNEIYYLFWDSNENKIISLIASDYNTGDEYVTVFTGNGATALLNSLTGYSVNIWSGSTDGDWNNTENWSTSLLNDMFADVHIPEITRASFPDLTSSTGECNNFTMEAGSSILGNENLTINGTVSVGTDISPDQWHMVSSPVDGETADVYHLGGDPNVYLTDYDEATETYNYITDLDTELSSMKGYMLWMNSARYNVTYSGPLSSGTFGSTDNLTRNTTGDGPGWNMVGNPYPSSIDWDAASGWTKTNLDDAIYIINNGSWASYVDGTGNLGGSQYVAPGQGFFVRVSSGNTSGTLQMTDDVRVNNNTTFLKAKEISDYVKFAVTDGSKSDETVVRFKEGTTSNFDSQYDAYKRFATNEEYPQIFTYTDETYSINSLPVPETLPLGFTCGLSEEFTISSIELQNIEHIWLEDQLMNTFTNLLDEDYTFSYQAGENSDRFVLHFTALSIGEDEMADLNIYSYQNWVNIHSENHQNGTVEIFNIMGQQIASDILKSGSCKIRIDQKGYYLVKVVSNGISKTNKVFVN